MDISDTGKHEQFKVFVDTIATLRGPQGCPWDREQTHASIGHNMIEEAYEALDAIESKDAQHLREELGDVLLQVVLQSQIAADAGEFTIDDVCADVNAKMIRRHPHVFGDASVENAAATQEIWAKVKREEREQAPKGQGTLDSVPKSLPALMAAQKISRKAVAAGFEWNTLDDVYEQLFSEIDEIREAQMQGDATALELECGDALFCMVNVCRKLGVDAETALRASNAKFRKRWSYIEQHAGGDVAEITTAQIQALWDEAKRGEVESA